MKDFLSVFPDSARELKQVRTLTVTALLMALAIVLRSLSIPIGMDIRITFNFLGVVSIAMLYGPVVSMLAGLGVDIIGYLLDGSKMREYNVLLGMVVMLNAMIYGLMLYHRKSRKGLLASAILARGIVILVGNLLLNSSILYVSYINPDYPFHMSGSEWAAFGTWMLPRLIKNVGQFPFDVIMLCVFLPVVAKAYEQVFHRSVLSPSGVH